MNTFYFNDKTEKFQLEQPSCSYTKVETAKDFDTFVEDYEQSIEWAR